MRKKVNKVKSVWPAAKGNTGFSENECSTWDRKLITRGKLYPLFLSAVFFPSFLHFSVLSHALPFLWFLAENRWGPIEGLWDLVHLHYIVHAKHLHLTDTFTSYLLVTLSVESLKKHKPSSDLIGDSKEHDRPPSTSSSQILNNMRH